MSELAGVFAPIVTPFRTDGVTIDFAWIPYHLQYLQSQGLDGVVPMGTTGEGPSLSVNERKAILDTVIARRGNLKVIPGVGTPSLTETEDLIRHAFASGADSVLVLPPYYWRNVGDKGLLTYFRTLCDRALQPGQKIMLYHIPQISGVPITLDLLDGLLETHADCILGLKDSSGHVNSFLTFMRRYPTLRVFVGSDRLVGIAYELGVAGTITAAANLVPKAIQEIRIAAQTGRDYTRRQEELAQLRDLLQEFAPLQASIKVLLARITRMPLTFVRPPLTNLPPEQRFHLLRRAELLPILESVW
ncbi:MAG: dihydrodipicolinate synthase family protein [Chloroflexi bacterium]|nr:dihydrodipicolinate synthase family protein [Chloroflexota bacterium]